MLRQFLPIVAAILTLAFTPGCQLLPDIAYQPTVHNPFPQLSRVAIAPFFNASTEPTVDGQQFAVAYYNELQDVPGFEVVPVGVVETQMKLRKIQLNGPEDVQRLARELEVDAVVIGVVTDYSPYYPPRLGLQVKWFAANPGFHPIPPGYGLPWGTPGEEEIPAPLVFEAEFALAQAQLKTQTPDCRGRGHRGRGRFGSIRARRARWARRQSRRRCRNRARWRPAPTRRGCRAVGPTHGGSSHRPRSRSRRRVGRPMRR